MFDTRGAVMLYPPWWDEPDPPDLGDWEPIPDELWRECQNTVPFYADDETDIPFPDKPVDEAVRLPLGPHTLRLLQETPVSEMTATAKAWALRRAGELVSYIDAFRVELTASLAGPQPKDTAEDWGAHEVALATKNSIYAADRQVAVARALDSRLTATKTAMDEGRISYLQARELCEQTAHLTDKIALAIEARMLKYSHRQDLPKFKASLRRWLARLDPEFLVRSINARREIIVEHTANDDGTGVMFIRAPLEKTALLDTALSAYARQQKNEQGGTTEERKVNGLIEWAEAYLTSPDTPRRHGRAYTVQVILDAPTMFGLANHPAEISGYGMVPAEAALDLLADGSPIRRLIIDEHDGRLVHYGTKTYVVPPPLVDHLVALHHTSAAPHSSVPAAGCDMEHNIPHQRGGTTDPDNNTPIDRRWHRAKTHAGWTYVINKDASVTWTSPHGLTETVYPHDYRLGP